MHYRQNIAFWYWLVTIVVLSMSHCMAPLADLIVNVGPLIGFHNLNHCHINKCKTCQYSFPIDVAFSKVLQFIHCHIIRFIPHLTVTNFIKFCFWHKYPHFSPKHSSNPYPYLFPKNVIQRGVTSSQCLQHQMRKFMLTGLYETL